VDGVQGQGKRVEVLEHLQVVKVPSNIVDHHTVPQGQTCVDGQVVGVDRQIVGVVSKSHTFITISRPFSVH